MMNLTKLSINFKIKLMQRLKDMNKKLQLEHEMARTEGVRHNLGAIDKPEHYEIKKADQGFFFVCWDGERSVCAETPSIALGWAKDNAIHKTGSWKKVTI